MTKYASGERDTRISQVQLHSSGFHMCVCESPTYERQARVRMTGLLSRGGRNHKPNHGSVGGLWGVSAVCRDQFCTEHRPALCLNLQATEWLRRPCLQGDPNLLCSGAGSRMSLQGLSGACHLVTWRLGQTSTEGSSHCVFCQKHVRVRARAQARAHTHTNTYTHGQKRVHSLRGECHRGSATQSQTCNVCGAPPTHRDREMCPHTCHRHAPLHTAHRLGQDLGSRSGGREKLPMTPGGTCGWKLPSSGQQ